MKKAVSWNLIGSTCYSVSSFLYLFIVTRLCGVEIAGFFSLSYATAQLLLTVGRYGMRTYQATDLQRKYSFLEYSLSRGLTCLVMLLLGYVYSFFSFKGEYVIISFFIIAMKMIDAVEDVFHGNFQQKYHVEVMGKMLAARNVYSAVIFTLVLAGTGNLKVTCMVTAVTSFLLCLVLNWGFTCKYQCLEAGVSENGNRVSWRDRRRVIAGSTGGQVLELLGKCTPFFIGTFLSLLLYNIPKYALAGVMSDAYQTYYSILFMPSFICSLMCEFVFKPTITTIAQFWWEKDWKQFGRYVGISMGIIAGFGAVIVLGGHFIGRYLLEIIYGVDLSPYKLDFILLLIGGGIGAGVYMLYNILIAIRRGKCIMYVYGIAAVLTMLPARWMTTRWGVRGAALNYLFSCGILFLMFAAVFGYVVRKEKKIA